MEDFQKILASDHEIAHVCNAARDLHWSYMHDEDSRKYIRHPQHIRWVEIARNQLDEVIRKAKFSAPETSERLSVSRQAPSQQVPA